PTGVVEGRGQGVHREDRLSHPGRTDAVNPVLVNRYLYVSGIKKNSSLFIAMLEKRKYSPEQY
ncbi:hypothetical protein, partial [Aeromonas caviae]|uniref:hypothetical protein n=1 Tax=Aeromonas caviae TaxID=648 RepID=UPI001CC72A7E